MLVTPGSERVKWVPIIRRKLVVKTKGGGRG